MNLRYRPSRKTMRLMISFSAITVLGLVAFRIAWVQTHRLGTAARLQHIQVALEFYHMNYGCYPPQYLTDRQGRPAHSWRVLLLKIVDSDLYQRYRFDEPWNGPHNKLLAPEMPEIYRSPFLDSNSTIAQYVGIAGKDTPWQGTTPQRRQDMIPGRTGLEDEGPNPLILFVEAANSDIHWMEPRDIPVEQALKGIDSSGGIQSNYSAGLPAQMIYYERKLVPSDTSSDTFRKMLTISDSQE